VKVLVSSVTNGQISHVATLEAAIVTLRRRTRDTTPWLWINLPNEKAPELCSYVMFGNRKGADLLRRRKADRFREVDRDGSIRIGIQRVASAA